MKSRRRVVAVLGIGALLVLLLLLTFSRSTDEMSPVPPAPASMQEEAPVLPPPTAFEPVEPPIVPEAEPTTPRPPAVLFVTGKGKSAPGLLRVRRGLKELVVSAELDPGGRRRIEFPGLVAGTELEIAAAGFVPARVVLAGDPPTAVAVLFAHARLVVTDSISTGQALQLRRLGEDEEPPLTFTAPGSVEFPELAAGTHEFEVLALERLPLGRFKVALDWGERKRIDIEERGLGVVVEGRTVDPEGRAVREADVIVRSDGLPEGAELAEVEVKSDLCGEFRVRLREEIKFSFRGEKPGYGPRDTPVVLATAAMPPVEVVLSTDSTLSGRVVDIEGTPLPGIEVSASRVLERDGSFVDKHRGRVTDAKGRFLFDDLPTGWLVRLATRTRGRANPRNEPVRIEPGVEEQIIVLPLEHRFEVRVVDAVSGEPVPGAKFNNRLPARVLGPGRYEIGGCALGASVVLGVHVEGFYRESWSGTVGGPVVVQLRPRRGITVEGRVVDTAGRPVDGATVSVVWMKPHPRSREDFETHGMFKRTGRDGRFTLSHLNRGARYQIHAVRPAFRGKTLASSCRYLVPKRGEEIVLVARGVGRFNCRLVWPDEVTTRSQVLVQFDECDRSLEERWPQCPAVPGAERNSVGSIPEGTYDVSIRVSGYQRVVLRNVEIRSGKSTGGGEVRLSRGSLLEVVLSDPEGGPVPGWRIVALLPGKALRFGPPTDAEGRTRVSRSIPQGEWYVLGWPNHDRFPVLLLGKLMIGDTAPRLLEATVTEPAELTVEVRDARGRAQAGLAIEVVAVAEPPLERLLTHGLRAWGWWTSAPNFPERVWAERELVTNASGRVEVGPLATGTYRVRAGEREVTAILTAGESRVLVIE